MSWYCNGGMFWVRLNKWCLYVKDTEKELLLFGERNGHAKGGSLGKYYVGVRVDK